MIKKTTVALFIAIIASVCMALPPTSARASNLGIPNQDIQCYELLANSQLSSVNNLLRLIQLWYQRNPEYSSLDYPIAEVILNSPVPINPFRSYSANPLAIQIGTVFERGLSEISTSKWQELQDLLKNWHQTMHEQKQATTQANHAASRLFGLKVVERFTSQVLLEYEHVLGFGEYLFVLGFSTTNSGDDVMTVLNRRTGKSHKIHSSNWKFSKHRLANVPFIESNGVWYFAFQTHLLSWNGSEFIATTLKGISEKKAFEIAIDTSKLKLFKLNDEIYFASPQNPPKLHLLNTESRELSELKLRKNSDWRRGPHTDGAFIQGHSEIYYVARELGYNSFSTFKVKILANSEYDLEPSSQGHISIPGVEAGFHETSYFAENHTHAFVQSGSREDKYLFTSIFAIDKATGFLSPVPWPESAERARILPRWMGPRTLSTKDPLVLEGIDNLFSPRMFALITRPTSPTAVEVLFLGERAGLLVYNAFNDLIQIEIVKSKETPNVTLVAHNHGQVSMIDFLQNPWKSERTLTSEMELKNDSRIYHLDPETGLAIISRQLSPELIEHSIVYFESHIEEQTESR